MADPQAMIKGPSGAQQTPEQAAAEARGYISSASQREVEAQKRRQVAEEQVLAAGEALARRLGMRQARETEQQSFRIAAMLGQAGRGAMQQALASRETIQAAESAAREAAVAEAAFEQAESEFQRAASEEAAARQSRLTIASLYGGYLDVEGIKKAMAEEQARVQAGFEQLYGYYTTRDGEKVFVPGQIQQSAEKWAQAELQKPGQLQYAPEEVKPFAQNVLVARQIIEQTPQDYLVGQRAVQMAKEYLKDPLGKTDFISGAAVGYQQAAKLKGIEEVVGGRIVDFTELPRLGEIRGTARIEGKDIPFTGRIVRQDGEEHLRVQYQVQPEGLARQFIPPPTLFGNVSMEGAFTAAGPPFFTQAPPGLREEVLGFTPVPPGMRGIVPVRTLVGEPPEYVTGFFLREVKTPFIPPEKWEAVLQARAEVERIEREVGLARPMPGPPPTLPESRESKEYKKAVEAEIARQKDPGLLAAREREAKAVSEFMRLARKNLGTVGAEGLRLMLEARGMREKVLSLPDRNPLIRIPLAVLAYHATLPFEFAGGVAAAGGFLSTLTGPSIAEKGISPGTFGFAEEIRRGVLGAPGGFVSYAKEDPYAFVGMLLSGRPSAVLKPTTIPRAMGETALAPFRMTYQIAQGAPRALAQVPGVLAAPLRRMTQFEREYYATLPALPRIQDIPRAVAYVPRLVARDLREYAQRPERMAAPAIAGFLTGFYVRAPTPQGLLGRVPRPGARPREKLEPGDFLGFRYEPGVGVRRVPGGVQTQLPAAVGLGEAQFPGMARAGRTLAYTALDEPVLKLGRVFTIAPGQRGVGLRGIEQLSEVARQELAGRIGELPYGTGFVRLEHPSTLSGLKKGDIIELESRRVGEPWQTHVFKQPEYEVPSQLLKDIQDLDRKFKAKGLGGVSEGEAAAIIKAARDYANRLGLQDLDVMVRVKDPMPVFERVFGYYNPAKNLIVLNFENLMRAARLAETRGLLSPRGVSGLENVADTIIHEIAHAKEGPLAKLETLIFGPVRELSAERSRARAEEVGRALNDAYANMDSAARELQTLRASGASSARVGGVLQRMKRLEREVAVLERQKTFLQTKMQAPTHPTAWFLNYEMRLDRDLGGVVMGFVKEKPLLETPYERFGRRIPPPDTQLIGSARREIEALKQEQMRAEIQYFDAKERVQRISNQIKGADDLTREILRRDLEAARRVMDSASELSARKLKNMAEMRKFLEHIQDIAGRTVRKELPPRGVAVGPELGFATRLQLQAQRPLEPPRYDVVTRAGARLKMESISSQKTLELLKGGASLVRRPPGLGAEFAASAMIVIKKAGAKVPKRVRVQDIGPGGEIAPDVRLLAAVETGAPTVLPRVRWDVGLARRQLFSDIAYAGQPILGRTQQLRLLAEQYRRELSPRRRPKVLRPEGLPYEFTPGARKLGRAWYDTVTRQTTVGGGPAPPRETMYPLLFIEEEAGLGFRAPFGVEMPPPRAREPGLVGLPRLGLEERVAGRPSLAETMTRLRLSVPLVSRGVPTAARWMGFRLPTRLAPREVPTQRQVPVARPVLAPSLMPTTVTQPVLTPFVGLRPQVVTRPVLRPIQRPEAVPILRPELTPYDWTETFWFRGRPPRRRPRRFPPRKRVMGPPMEFSNIAPKADWLRVQAVEATIRGKAVQPPQTAEFKRLYARYIKETGAVAFFPTLQEIQQRRRKVRRRRK